MRFWVVFHCKTDDAMGRSYDERLGTVTQLSSATVVGSARLDAHLSSADIQSDSTVLCHEIELTTRARLQADIDVTFACQDLQWSTKGLVGEQLHAAIGRDKFDRATDFINLDVALRRVHRQSIHDWYLDDDIRLNSRCRGGSGDHVDDEDRAPVTPVNSCTPRDGVHRLPGLVISPDPVGGPAGNRDVGPCPCPGVNAPDGDITGKGVHLDGHGTFQVEWLVLSLGLDRAARGGEQQEAQQEVHGSEPGIHGD